MRPLDHLVEAGQRHPQRRQPLGGRVARVGHAPQHLHAPRVPHLPDEATDVAGPDHAQRLAPEQRAAETGLRPLALTDEAVREGDVAREREQQREGQLGYRGPRHAGDPDHPDPSLPGTVERSMLSRPEPARTTALSPGAEWQDVPGEDRAAPQDDDLRVGDGLAQVAGAGLRHVVPRPEGRGGPRVDGAGQQTLMRLRPHSSGG